MHVFFFCDTSTNFPHARSWAQAKRIEDHQTPCGHFTQYLAWYRLTHAKTMANDIFKSIFLWIGVLQSALKTIKPNVVIAPNILPDKDQSMSKPWSKTSSKASSSGSKFRCSSTGSSRGSSGWLGSEFLRISRVTSIHKILRRIASAWSSRATSRGQKVFQDQLVERIRGVPDGMKPSRFRQATSRVFFMSKRAFTSSISR